MLAHQALSHLKTEAAFQPIGEPVGNLTLGGGVETVLHPAGLAELAMEKGASALLVPVSARRALVDVSDEVATKVAFIYYTDARDALIKALDE